jgi:hypothetical protein
LLSASEVLYAYKDVLHKYRPDFIVQLKTGNFSVFETKPKIQIEIKRSAHCEWAKAVNAQVGSKMELSSGEITPRCDRHFAARRSQKLTGFKTGYEETG